MSSPTFEPVNIYNYLKHLGTSSTGHNNLSLLKELIDNSFDAKAKNIVTDKQEGNNSDGTKYYQIRYKDDGTGMSQENLYRFVQLHSENINGGIGKFGIGGISTLVNWCDIEDNIYEKNIIIISRTEDNIVRQVKINWNQCKTLNDYTNQVVDSYTENDSLSLQCLKNENISQGTIIIIQTSEKKYTEIMELEDDMQDYIDIGTTYQNYLEKGNKIFLFGEQIRHYAISKSLLSDTFQIEIWGKKTMTAFLTKIGKKSLVFKYDKNKKEKKITSDNLENEDWKLICDVSLKLEMPGDLYITKNKKDKFNLKGWDSFNEFCHKNGIDSENEIYYLAEDYIKKLYISREDNYHNARTLGGLDFSMTGFYDDDINIIGKCIKKQLVFNHKFDKKLGLTQQNKSVVEWTNAPIGMQQYIIKIINLWVKDKLKPRIKEVDKEEQRLRDFYIPLETSMTNKTNYYLRTKDNKYIPTYLNQSSPISAGMAIWKAFQSRMQNKIESARKIKAWFRNQKKFYCIPITGFIKFQKFIQWAYKHYSIMKIQKWYSNILLKRALINYVLSPIVYKIIKSRSILLIQRHWRRYIISKKSIENENNMAVIIQKRMRKYFASKLFEEEKRKEKCFKNLSHNFKKNVKCPGKRQKFNLFKREILSQLKEMEELL
uniref:Histidine kinase/HSP90-like ATPase domain-containing protein n=1 Tax=viral metagenome TaxID=1070528 RepID=A0A6C0L0E4_9ZZZZ|tara:strand:+ start:2501 stop:4474 length:1974 start_codon:yes stop_codon:yes gene_type:complete